MRRRSELRSETLAQLAAGPNESLAIEAELELRRRRDEGDADAELLLFRLEAAELAEVER